MVHQFIAVSVTVLVFLTLMLRRGAPTELVFLGGLVAVTLAGVIGPEQALVGLANPAVVTIAALYVVAAGLRTTGALDLIGYHLLGTARTEGSALLRLTAPLVGLSALINNTPIVAMTVPTVIDWCRRVGVSPSRLLMPVSYLAILGGTCTLIGTSTNLIVNGLILEPNLKLAEQGVPQGQIIPMHFFEIGYVGFPCEGGGIVCLLMVGRHL